MVRPVESFEISGRTGYRHHYSSRKHFIDILEKRRFPTPGKEILRQVFEQDPEIGFTISLDIHQLIKDGRRKDVVGKKFIWYITSNRLTAIGSYYNRYEDFVHATVAYDLGDDGLYLPNSSFLEILKGK